MLEKLIIELGGVVPKDLLGAGQGEMSHSNSGLAENSDVMTDINGMATTQATDNEGGLHPVAVATMESGTDGNGLYGQLEEEMLQRMEQVVQDVEDEQDFR